MKIMGIKIDSGERVERSLWIIERRACGHEATLAAEITIEIRVLSRKFVVLSNLFLKCPPVCLD